jgi:putative transposase
MIYLWRAVDYEGEILESYVTKSRDKAAALRFLRKALKRHGSPEVFTTDGLRSYWPDERAWLRGKAGGWPLGQQPGGELTSAIRRRERAMLRFGQMKSLLKFASVHANVHNHLPRTPSRQSTDLHDRRSAALAKWQLLRT